MVSAAAVAAVLAATVCVAAGESARATRTRHAATYLSPAPMTPTGVLLHTAACALAFLCRLASSALTVSETEAHRTRLCADRVA